MEGGISSATPKWAAFFCLPADPPDDGPRRPGGAAECRAAPGKARAELGWQAEKGVEDMCRDARRWQQELDREDRGGRTG